MAYLISNNVHYNYLHSIHNKFTQSNEIVLYEFVHRGMLDIRPMKEFEELGSKTNKPNS